MWTSAVKPGMVEGSKATFLLWTSSCLLVYQRLTDEWKIYLMAFCRPITTRGPNFFHQSSHILSFFPLFVSSLQPFLLPQGTGATLLPVGTVDNKHPRHAPCVAPGGQEAPLTHAPAPTAMTTRTICPSNLPLKEPVPRDKHTYSLAAADWTRVKC